MKNYYSTRVLGMLLALIAFSLAPFGKTVAQSTCAADAGTLTPDASPVAFVDGTAMISASVATSATLPEGFEQLYVLTMGDDLVLRGANATPTFNVDMTGTYRIHSLVANTTIGADGVDDNELDLSVVNFGETTAQDVLDLVAANDICASLDAMGAKVVVEEAMVMTCDAQAAMLTADAATVTLADGSADLSATVATAASVPDDFESVYVLTMGDDLVIEGVSATPSFTVDMAGTYRLHSLVANVDVTEGTDDNQLDLSVVEFGVTTAGAVLDLVAANDICASLDATGAKVVVEEGALNNGGTVTGLISTPDGRNLVGVCDGDDGDDHDDNDDASTVTAQLNYDTPAGQVAYVLTDKNFVILEIQSSPTFDFSDEAPDTYHIWAFNYTGDITGAAGESVFSTRFSSMDWTISQNCIVVNVGDGCQEPPMGIMTGMIASSTGDNPVAVCVSDDDDDDDDHDDDDDDNDDDDDSDSGSTVTVTVDYAINTGQLAYVLTDKDFNILAIQGDPTFDFSDSAPGTYHLWSFNYSGEITGMVGDNVFDTRFSDDMWLISQNCIIVNVGDGCTQPADGGTITFADGSTSQDVCIAEGSGGTVSVTQTGRPVGETQTYLITDDEANILAIPSGNGPFDLSAAGPGTCLIWYLSYNGTLSGLEPGANAADLAGDFALSNSVSAVRNSVDGGAIAFDDGSSSVTIVVDATGDPLDVQQIGMPTGSNFTFVITDMDGNILDLPAGDGPFDLNGAGVGTCLIWYLAFEDNLSGAAIGNNASELQGCFDLSNPLTVERVAATGIIATEIATPAGSNTATVCVGEDDHDDDDDDDDDDTVTVEFTEATNTGQLAYVLTDKDFNILLIQDGATFDFSDRAAGTYHLWAFNYTGDILAMAGDPAFTTRFSDEEFRISRNCIVVTVGDDCGEPDGASGFTFTAAPVSDNEVVIRRPAAELVVADIAELVSIRITTATGRVVNSVDRVPSSALESYLVDINGGGSGIYFVTVIRADEAITQQVVLQ